jgi:putative transcriptional regulator
MASLQPPFVSSRRLIAAVVLALVGLVVGAALYLNPLSTTADAAGVRAAAGKPSGPMLLVASVGLEDLIYGGAVIVATPLEGDRYAGFIINWPTDIGLADAYPGPRPVQELRSRLYVGGPYLGQSIFALVRRPTRPAGKWLELAPGLYAAIDRTAVDEVIRVNGEDARYVVGLIIWPPHELEREVEAGSWTVVRPASRPGRQPADASEWDEFVRRAQEAARPH